MVQSKQDNRTVCTHYSASTIETSWLVLLLLHSGTFYPLPHPTNPRHHIFSLILYHLFSMTFVPCKGTVVRDTCYNAKCWNEHSCPSTPSQQPEHVQCLKSQVSVHSLTSPSVSSAVILTPIVSFVHYFILTLRIQRLNLPISLGQARKMLNEQQ